MITDLQTVLSTNVKGMKRSAIRELLKFLGTPGLISFSGGFPAPATFPTVELKEIMMKVMDTEAAFALQYGATEGDNLLRTLLVERYKAQGVDMGVENLIITTASQQALDLIAKIFIDRDDYVFVGLPSYLGGLSAFNSYGAKMIGIPMDDEGEDPEFMENELKKLAVIGKKPKFIYLIPDFQNPAGVTMTEKRRKEILALAHKYDVLIIEDSPYRELRYEGKTQKTMYELDGTGHVIMLGTFSKIFCPGFRIGWVVGHPDVLDKIVVAKQATDLCTPPFTQRIAARYIEKGLLDPKIEDIRKLYSTKQKGFLDALDKYMPEEITWTKPQGGLFMMANAPEYIDTGAILMDCIKEQKVAYVAGTSFFCDGGGKNTMRLNFSYETLEKNDEGVKRLGDFFKSKLTK
ncbi:MAG: PLP-dependent aminotransferase family protein [Candidatus Cloacimonetes bacterium]|nr:PLP-dependent aminotransferase family protein [Candidatus Cloacimonadota bacterium]MCB5286590.1 PLP-dependent aminotransferase family protein [Candidatus Cloacimonadota bacterium]MCK9184906.1 PLP-dependent aminotransferase family protein [Candidatus Cloacimonadota bacterium]MCK9583592.1 PLP-dependent aminotransferase family protein [Candidatus Cloacimonadota bacterium]MDY0228911.1 PLP-dependent aminotransferase family protein [Candidatus Cloacimonadaceae bacterium]